MTTSVLAAAGPSPLWYVTRGTGLVSLLLLTASVTLGVVNVSRWARPGWPRFLTAGLHRNVSLLVVAVLAVHILTAEADTFAPVGWLAVAIPFVSSYRPIWLGLGTVAFDLVVALVVTSLLRGRLGYRTWRAVHWAAYLSWPVAVVHGLGTGTDTRLGWVLFVTMVCVAVVIVALGWRLAHDWPARPGTRLAGGAAAVVAVAVVGVWTVTGPLRPGWAKKAGTPPTLLASAPPPAHAPGPLSTSTPASPAATGGVPAPPFSAVLAGTLHQTGPGPSGEVTLDITTRVSGPMAGTLDIVLRGQAADGGVSLNASTVTFGTAGAPAQYRGQVVALNGTQVAASVTANSAPPLTLGIDMRIDPTSGSVRGTLHAQRAPTGPAAATGPTGATSEGSR